MATNNQSNRRTSIRIEGNEVSFEETIIHATVALPEFLEKQRQQGINLTSPTLPPGTRIYKKLPDRELFVVEEPPRVRTIRWKRWATSVPENVPDPNSLPDPYEQGINQEEASRRLRRRQVAIVEQRPRRVEEIRTWNLAFPYCVFVIQANPAGAIQHGWFFFRPAPLRSVEDDLFQCTIPNVHVRSHQICMGEVQVEGTNISERLSGFVEAFWAGTFNHDYHETFDAARNLPPIDKPDGLGDPIVEPFCVTGIPDILNPNILAELIQKHQTAGKVNPFVTQALWQQVSEAAPLFPLSVQYQKVGTLNKMGFWAIPGEN